MKSPGEDNIKLFEKWYESDMTRLFSYVCYRVRERETAEELTAAVLERAAESLGRYDPAKGTMTAWMLGIARYELMHYMRDARSRNAPVSLEALPEIRAEGDSPEELAHNALLMRSTLQQITRLTEREQELIALRYGADLPTEEIARVMGLTPGNVRVLLHRAIEKLQSLLASVNEAENA